MLVLENKLITKPGQLGSPFTAEDGLGIASPNETLVVRDSVIDLSEVPLDVQDEAAAVTWGSSATFERCIIREAGKLFLAGSGDKDKRSVELGKYVDFKDCILENFGRRGPEVQCGMVCHMEHCLVQNWGMPEQFTVRVFGAWAHDVGHIDAEDCIFLNKDRMTLWQRIQDRAYHFSQAIKDNGLKAIVDPMTYVAGWRRGLTASDTGRVSATHCYADDDIILPEQDVEMGWDEMNALYLRLEQMREYLYQKLGIL